MSEPREWWAVIYEGPREEDGDVILGEIQSDPPINPDIAIKVIEKSAYDQLKSKCDVYERALEHYAELEEPYHAALYLAREVLRKYRGEK